MAFLILTDKFIQHRIFTKSLALNILKSNVKIVTRLPVTSLYT